MKMKPIIPFPQQVPIAPSYIQQFPLMNLFPSPQPSMMNAETYDRFQEITEEILIYAREARVRRLLSWEARRVNDLLFALLQISQTSDKINLQIPDVLRPIITTATPVPGTVPIVPLLDTPPTASRNTFTLPEMEVARKLTSIKLPIGKKRGRKPIDKTEFRCRSCGATKTPEWRKGPDGKNTLCNACGLRWKKKDPTLIIPQSVDKLSISTIIHHDESNTSTTPPISTPICTPTDDSATKNTINTTNITNTANIITITES